MLECRGDRADDLHAILSLPSCTQNENDLQHYIRSIQQRFARRLKDALEETNRKLTALQVECVWA